MIVQKYLVVRADGSARIVSRRPLSWKMRKDEVGFKLNFIIPEAWGRLDPNIIEVRLPEPPAGVVVTDFPTEADER